MHALIGGIAYDWYAMKVGHTCIFAVNPFFKFCFSWNKIKPIFWVYYKETKFSYKIGGQNCLMSFSP